MAWEIHLAKTAFSDFTDDWDRLNARLYDRHPFADSRFVGALLDHFGDGSERLCVHRNDGGISGALILCPAGVGRWSQFSPPQRQIAAILLDDVRLLESLLCALPRPAWTIELHAIDPRYSPDFSRLTLPLIFQPHARTIGVRQWTNFSDYWQQRPRNREKNIRRYLGRAGSEFGPTRLSKLANAPDLNAGLKRFGVLETAGWKGKAGAAISSDNQQGAFYGDILRRFASTSQAAIYELHIGDHLASSRLVLINNHITIILKTTYDKSLARFAPCRPLRYRLIEEQFALPAKRTMEFDTNATSDQKEWATFARTIHNIQLFRNPAIAATFSALRALRRNPGNLRDQLPDSASLTGGVQTCKQIETLKEEGYDLRAFSAEDHLEASDTWCELLEKHVYATDAGVRYYSTVEKKSPRVILPVRLTAKGPIKIIESLSNYYTSLYVPLLSKGGDLLDLQTLLAAAAHDHGAAHVMRFAPMNPHSPAYKALLSGLRANNWIPFQFFCFGNWYLKVEGTWQDYLKGRSGSVRSNIGRACKKFAAAGGTFEIATNLERIDQYIAAYEEIYSASWKTPEPHPDFVPELIRELAARGMLRLGIARLKGRAIAAQLWFVDAKKASIYKVAYHEEFASHSPGTVLTAHLMQHVIDRDRVREVDFLIGEDGYKRLWMSDRRERWGIVAYNPATVIGFALLLKEAAGRLLKPLAAQIRRVVVSRRHLAKSGKDPANQR
ncbi:GNAT family N-acetyltransferase [Accumulibacter sp.]|uniref:GNAT family N-acetyltransferase n=1 Tax=Accumulibacter sp. TaxID=2053492 RepID=UPI0028C3DD6B|nr:GNAT family N-acetyltransferase [Accumulibacter sp.]